jgi:hypothetical protein
MLNKTYPIKVVTNSRLLDMQGYKGFIDSAEAATKGKSLLILTNLVI